ncbi:MAG: glutaminyl-peptide cyclotransferase [Pseudonocardia sp.]|nr:glutaminyl-peptide cyclotransferase [Pseudonocardia sp.]
MRPLRLRSAVLVLVVAALAGCGAAAAPADAVPVQRLTVLGTVPHDPAAFTEGLELDGGILYEGTGLRNRSELRELDPATGAVRRSAPVPDGAFGEGVTVAGDRIWQLTYTEGVALERDRASLAVLRRVPIGSQGWGLCNAGDRLIRSDGTSTLHFHDPVTFAETGTVDVTLEGSPLPELNELECVDGRVWANVWNTERLVRIDPATGVVDRVVDASGLLTADQRAGTDVLNGIAHVSGDEYLITGKYWPTIFRVRLPS